MRERGKADTVDTSHLLGLGTCNRPIKESGPGQGLDSLQPTAKYGQEADNSIESLGQLPTDFACKDLDV